MVSYEIYPRFANITDITKAGQAVVTFDDEHDFTDGEILGFRVSQEHGMYQINNRYGRVLSHDTDTVTVDIDTSDFNTFVLDSESQYPAVAVPAASGIIPNQYVATMNLEDSFDNRRT